MWPEALASESTEIFSSSQKVVLSSAVLDYVKKGVEKLVGLNIYNHSLWRELIDVQSVIEG